MFTHSLRQRLDSLEQQERVERRHRCSDVAQLLGPKFGRKCVFTEVVPPLQPVVAGDGIGHDRESAVAPVEGAGVDDHAADRCAMSAEELRGRLHDDVGAELDRAAEVRRRKSIVDDQRHTGCPRHGADRLEVGDFTRRVGDDLGVDGLRVVVDGGGNCSGVVRVHEARVYTESPKCDIELSDRAAVERRVRDDVVARPRQRRHGEKLSGLATRCSNGADTALEVRHPFLERGDGRVGDPGVDRAELLESEEVGRILGVLEHETGRLVDRHGASARVWVGAGPGVQRPRSEPEFAINHGTTLPVRIPAGGPGGSSGCSRDKSLGASLGRADRS